MTNWNKKIDMKYVLYAKKMLKNPLFDVNIPVLHRKHDENYIIDNVRITGYTVKDKKTKDGTEDRGAIFCILDCELLLLGKTYYPPPRFSIPKSQLESFETGELNYPQRLVITEWAFENSYTMPFNKVYEHWGRMMKSMCERYRMRCWDYAPMYTYSPYRNIIDELHKQKIREEIKNYKKKRGFSVEGKNDSKSEVVHKKYDENNVWEETKQTVSNSITNHRNSDAIKKNKKINNKRVEPFRKNALYIFYTNGSGNIMNNKKQKDSAHFSIYLKNTEERWKRREDKLTGNQAELLGVMSAISIANERQYKNIKILTDSNNVVNWVNKKPNSNEYLWDAKHPNIIKYVKRLREMVSMIPNLQIKHVKREVNFAHAI